MEGHTSIEPEQQLKIACVTYFAIFLADTTNLINANVTPSQVSKTFVNLWKG
jgi:hypothetical protein